MVSLVTRITLYGWVVVTDPIRGNGSGSLIDLVYWIDDDHVSVRDIFDIVEGAGYKMISKKITGTKTPEADRITIENWNDHIRLGTENVGAVNFEENKGQYDRYNYPYSGGI